MSMQPAQAQALRPYLNSLPQLPGFNSEQLNLARCLRHQRLQRHLFPSFHDSNNGGINGNVPLLCNRASII